MPGQVLATDSLATVKLVTYQKASIMTSCIPFWAFSELTLLVLTKVLAGFTLDLAATLPFPLVSSVHPYSSNGQNHAPRRFSTFTSAAIDLISQTSGNVIPDTVPSLITLLIAMGTEPLTLIVTQAYMSFNVFLIQNGLHCDWIDARHQGRVGNAMNFRARRKVVRVTRRHRDNTDPRTWASDRECF